MGKEDRDMNTLDRIRITPDQLRALVEARAT